MSPDKNWKYNVKKFESNPLIDWKKLAYIVLHYPGARIQRISPIFLLASDVNPMVKSIMNTF